MANAKSKQDQDHQRDVNTSAPPRHEHQAILAQVEEDGHDVQLKTYYVIRNQWGEQEYISDDRKDAENRLRELAGVQIGPAGTPAGHPAPSPTGDPGRTLHEVQAVDPHGIPELYESYSRSVRKRAEAQGEYVEAAKVGPEEE